MKKIIHFHTTVTAPADSHFARLKTALKSVTTSAIVFCLLLLQPAMAQLTGTKTIGGTSPDYSTLAAAVTALNGSGVGTGGVTFEFRDGTYAGGTAVAAITATGTSANPIVFQSENDDASLVTISSSTNADVITLQGCSYITFNNLTIDYTGSSGYSALELAAGYNNDNVSVTNCVMDGSSATNTAYAYSVIYVAQTSNSYHNNNFVLTNSKVQDGSYGIYVSNYSSSSLGTGLDIEGNEFKDNYRGGLYLYYQDAVTISGNTIHTSKTYSATYGMNINSCSGKHEITDNYIYTDGSGRISYGIYLNGSASTSGNNALIVNNSIQVYNSTGSAYGIYQSSTSKYYDIYNNTVYISGGGSSSTYPYQSYTSSDGTNVKNNVFMNNGTSSTSLAIEIANTSGVSAIDYNCYYWTYASPYFRGKYGTTTYTTFSSYTTATGETNSLNINPSMSFTSGVGWKATASGLTGAGEYSSSIPKDIDGTNRLDPTTIGAHENGSGSSPLITASTTSLSQFVTTAGTPSSSQTFTVEGANLTANLVVTAPTDFQVKEQGVGSFGSSVSFTPSGGTVSTKTIEVRYNPSVAGSHSGNVTNTSTGATQKDVAVTGVSSNCTGPLSGTYTINPSASASCTNYKTFADAVSDLLTGTRSDDNTYFNGPGVGGAVVFEVASGTYNESIELTAVTGVSATNTITFRPASGATVTLTSGTAQTVNLNHVKYIIFDGRQGGSGTSRNFTIANTYSQGNAIQFVNEAQHDIFRYVVITGVNNSTNDTYRGVVRFSTSTRTNGNSNNTIEHSQLRDGSTTPRELIYAAGTTGKLNSDNTLSNNEFFNFFQASGTSIGINITDYNSDWDITDNDFYQTATRTPTSSTTTYAIYIGNISDGNNFQVTGNSIGGSTVDAGGSAWTVGGTQNNTFTGIFIDTYEGSGSVTSSVLNNTIANIDWTCQNNSSLSYPGIWAGIYASDGDINIGNTTGTGNVIGSATGTGSITITTNTDGAGSYGIIFASAVGSKSNKIAYNTIGSVTVAGASTSISSSFFGIYTPANSLTITNNLIGSTVTANSVQASTASTGTYNTQRIHGIEIGSGSGTDVISNNTIANLQNNYAGTDDNGEIRGIVTFSGAVEQITGNTIYNLSTASGNTAGGEDASVIGISDLSTASDQIISQNVIHSLSNTSASGDVEVNGIYFSGTSTSTSETLVDRNFVHSLTASTSGTAKINGIQIDRSSVGAYQNNLIRLGIDGSGNSIGAGYAFTGILINSENFNPKAQQIYFNTVYIGGTNISGSAVTAAFKRETAITSTPPNTENIKNNIFYNARTNSGGSGTHYGIMLPANTSTASDYNVLEADGTGGVLGSFNSTDYTTLANWQTASGMDANSQQVTPDFVDATGNSSSVDLHLDNASSTNNTYIKEQGVAISGITIDYAGDTRQDPPTIGALQLEGVPLPIQLVSFTADKVNNGLAALLQWTTATEINNDRFEVESASSTAGDELVFNQIGVVKGNGTSTVTHQYSFTDDAAGKTGTIYYRLRQVDEDGSYTYSDIRAVDFGDSGLLQSAVYPNPATDQLHYTVTSPDERSVTVSISNIIGQEIFVQTVVFSPGQNHLSFDIGSLAQGTYILNIRTAGEEATHLKFEKF